MHDYNDKMSATDKPFELGLMRAVLDNIPAYALVVDAKTENIIYSNKALEHFRQNEEIPASSLKLNQYNQLWQELKPSGKVIPHHDIPLVKALKQGETVANTEVLLALDNGERHWAMVSATPLRDDKNNIVAALAVWLDITEHKKNQHALLDAQQALQILKGILPVPGNAQNRLIRNN